MTPDANFEHLNVDELRRLLDAVAETRVGVLGDFCLDVYWFIDESGEELSLETGLPTRPVARQRCELGGAGNVARNMVAMGCRHVEVFGVVGPDVWGREMRRQFDEQGVRGAGLFTQDEDWATHAYVKPHVGDKESNRLDFGGFNRLRRQTAERLLAGAETALKDLDVLVINEQVTQGLHAGADFREGLKSLMRRSADKTFLVDSRHFSDVYPHASLVINEREAAGFIGRAYPPGASVSRDDAVHSAEVFFTRNARPTFVTRGPRGLVLRDESGLHEIPAIPVSGETDPVGAGDTMLAGVALTLAAGASPRVAAEFGNIAASITVRKLRRTGTATPAEILAVVEK
ncbi:MAG: hypothetical protein H6685_07755 [Deltaproteobacteria bacterium]|nr:hypothetical protein [Deltaproteobacteria bacterium]